AANWNNYGSNTGTSGFLNDSTGAATGVTISVTGAGLWGSGVGTGDANSKMLNGYVDGTDNGTNTWTFHNVPAGIYTLISYAYPDSLDGRSSAYTVNGGSEIDLMSDGNASYPNFGFVRATGTGGNYTSGNYIEFDNISPDVNGDIVLSGTGVFRNYSNGIQLVSVPAPEPTTGVLLGLGMVGLICVARRRI
ncbi:MAG TPA: PEP-CTERM sorting domain-containing protein, partial [Pirellulales bacterium]|nr:PEP-CTERM sorting domain-containing protein [Pirellulales bacterium]